MNRNSVPDAASVRECSVQFDYAHPFFPFHIGHHVQAVVIWHEVLKSETSHFVCSYWSLFMLNSVVI